MCQLKWMLALGKIGWRRIESEIGLIVPRRKQLHLKILCLIFLQKDEEIIMQAIKFVTHVSRQGKLKIPERMSLPAGRVEVILLCEDGNGKLKKRKKPLAQHPFVGMWADREDVADSITFATNLRRNLEQRRDRRR